MQRCVGLLKRTPKTLQFCYEKVSDSQCCGDFETLQKMAIKITRDLSLPRCLGYLFWSNSLQHFLGGVSSLDWGLSSAPDFVLMKKMELIQGSALLSFRHTTAVLFQRRMRVNWGRIERRGFKASRWDVCCVDWSKEAALKPWFWLHHTSYSSYIDHWSKNCSILNSKLTN